MAKPPPVGRAVSSVSRATKIESRHAPQREQNPRMTTSSPSTPEVVSGFPGARHCCIHHIGCDPARIDPELINARQPRNAGVDRVPSVAVQGADEFGGTGDRRLVAQSCSPSRRTTDRGESSGES
jgi:hypothetical protein